MQSIAFAVYGLVLCMFIAWQIAGTATYWFPVAQHNKDANVTTAVLNYCKKCYADEITFEEINAGNCPEFW